MDHVTAQSIAREHAPTLIVDPFNPAIPNALVVRASANGNPFSIHLPTTPENSSPDIDTAATERTVLLQSLDSALKELT